MTDLPAPLRGVQAKLERANAHLRVLDGEFDATFGGEHGQPIGMTKELHRDAGGKTGYFSIEIAHIAQPPIEVGVKVGDVIHNLRSALDHSVWQLGRLNRNGSKPHRGTAFPICRTSTDFESNATRDTLKHVHGDHRALIENCQPYHGGDFEALAYLGELSRTDKHQVVNIVLVAAKDFALSSRAVRDCDLRRDGLTISMLAGKPIEVDTEIAQVPIHIRGRRPDIDVESEGSLFVAFANGEPVMKRLLEIGNAVESVVERFLAVFETPAARKLGMGTEDEPHDWPRGFQRVRIQAFDDQGNLIGEGTNVLDEAAAEAADDATG